MSTRPGLKLGVLILDNSVGTGAGDRHTILPTPATTDGVAAAIRSLLVPQVPLQAPPNCISQMKRLIFGTY